MKVKKETRQQIKEQRRYRCDQCGTSNRDGQFCFQRKLNRKKHPDLANEPNNIKMLCQGCNHQWETERAANRKPSAKVNARFRKRIRAERGDRCEICGQPSPNEQELMSEEERSRRTLHLHHKNKQRTHPWIRCDRRNIILCCQSCHVQLEAELNVKLREQSAVESHSVANSENAGATYNSTTVDRKSAARVELRGEESLFPENPPSFPLLRPKVAGAERPKAETGEKTPLKTQSQNSNKTTSENRVNTIFKPLEDATPSDAATNGAYPPRNAVNVELKLRKQANKLGLIPGSPQWRSYVLGTLSAMKKRSNQKHPKFTT